MSSQAPVDGCPGDEPEGTHQGKESPTLDLQCHDEIIGKIQTHLERLLKALRLAEQHSSLEAQQKEFGPVLKRALPLGTSQTDPTAFPPVCYFLLDPVGRETRDFIQSVTAPASNPQQSPVWGLAHASGSGKTKLMFSLGTEAAHVVFIRLAHGNHLFSPAMEALQEAIEEVSSEIRGHVDANQIPKDVEEADIPPKTRAFLYERSFYALHVVRLFVFAHALWLVLVDREARELYSEWTPELQRRTWLRALENGAGSSGVEAIFRVFIQHMQSQRPSSNQVKNCCLSIMARLRACIDSGGSGPVVLAFDEIGAAKGIGAGVWSHWWDQSQEVRYRSMIQETFTKRPATSSNQLADLFFALKIVMRRLEQGYEVIAVMADTNLSLFDMQDEKVKSPLNPYLWLWSDMHLMTREDMVQHLMSCFDVSQEDLEPIGDCLEGFVGRPLFYFSRFLRPLLGECSQKKPKTATELVEIIQSQAPKWRGIAKESFKEQIVSKAWENRKTLEGGKTESVTLMAVQLYHQLTFLRPEDKYYTKEEIRYLATTGLLFGLEGRHDDQHSGRVRYDPRGESLTSQAIVEYGDDKLEHCPDFLLDHLLGPIRHRIMKESEVKGSLMESIFLWALVRASKVLSRKSSSLPSLSEVLQKAALVPPHFELPEPLGQWTFHAQSIDLRTANIQVSKLEPKAIYGAIPKVARPDFLVPLSEGILAIQCKSGGGNVADALCSVTPGCMFCPGDLEVLRLLREDPASLGIERLNVLKGSLEVHQEAHDLFFQDLPSERTWVRAVFSFSGFSKDAIRLVNAHNQSLETRDFVLLLQPDPDDPFWERVLSAISPSPNRLGLRPDQTWALGMWRPEDRDRAMEVATSSPAPRPTPRSSQPRVQQHQATGTSREDFEALDVEGLIGLLKEKLRISEKVERIFREEEVDGEALLLLTWERLRELQVPAGPAAKIMHLVNGLP